MKRREDEDEGEDGQRHEEVAGRAVLVKMPPVKIPPPLAEAPLAEGKAPPTSARQSGVRRTPSQTPTVKMPQERNQLKVGREAAEVAKKADHHGSNQAAESDKQLRCEVEELMSEEQNSRKKCEG